MHFYEQMYFGMNMVPHVFWIRMSHYVLLMFVFSLHKTHFFHKWTFGKVKKKVFIFTFTEVNFLEFLTKHIDMFCPQHSSQRIRLDWKSFCSDTEREERERGRSPLFKAASHTKATELSLKHHKAKYQNSNMYSTTVTQRQKEEKGKIHKPSAAN